MANRLTATLSVVGGLSGALSSTSGLNAEMTIPKTIYPESYEGSYTITPSDHEQEIEIKGLVAKNNITIEPIPSNYGRITWDGSIITVS